VAAPITMSFNLAMARKNLGIVTEREIRRFQSAAKKTATVGAAEIKLRGDRDILSAGNFTRRWTNAFSAQVRTTREQATIQVGFEASIPYALIHEYGGIIHGHPLLWIPLSWNPFPDRDARDYPGGLFYVDRPGKNPLLFSKTESEARYVGVPQVKLRPRFHLRAITSNVVRTQFARLFGQFAKEG